MAIDESITKICTKCCQHKPPAEFSKDAYKRDGLSTRCKSCRSAEHAAWRAKNPDAVKTNNAEWYAKNADRSRAYSREYRRLNLEQVKKTISNWGERNKDKKAEANKSWRQKNKARHVKNVIDWMKNNPEKVKSYRSNRKAKTRGSCGKVSVTLAENLLARQKGKCACCGNSIKNSYHMDHVMPLALGGLHVDNNIQLLCPPCNLSKGAIHPVDFMQKRGFLL